MRQTLTALLKDFPTEELVATVAKLLAPKLHPLAPPRFAATNPKIVVEPKAFSKRGVRVSRRGDKAYERGPKTYHGRAGTWTAYMVSHTLAHASTRAATAAQDQYTSKQLDFNWMVAQGFIQWKDD